MKNPLSLRVPEPCGQDWHTMLPDGTGRFCNQCNKTVIDFTGYTDRQLLAFFRQQSGPVCGRLTPYQLNRPVYDTLPGKGKTSGFRGMILAGLCLVGISSRGSVSFSRERPPALEQLPGNPQQQDTTKQKPGKRTRVIRGQVACKEHRDPLKNAVVVIENTNLYTYTDSCGCFAITLPDSIRAGKLELVMKADGYNVASQVLARKGNEWPSGTYYLKAEEMTTGAIVISPGKPEKDNIFKKIKRWFRRVVNGNFSNTRRLK